MIEILEFILGLDDLTFFLSFVTIVIALIATILVKTTFWKYNIIHTEGGKTSEEIAREILDANGLNHVMITSCAGDMTDHYDPVNQAVVLSETVFGKDTVGAIGVAAHEVGHAIQHEEGYLPVKIKSALFPVISVCTKYWYFIFFIGLCLEMAQLIWLAIILYAVGVVYQLVTLPVELDASDKAMETLSTMQYLNYGELEGARKTLAAAAFTYIAALVLSLGQLLRLLASAKRR